MVLAMTLMANAQETTTYDFDDSTLQGWTTIDANGDGYDWVLGSAVGGVYLVEGATLAGSGYNSSADMMCSGSFSNVTGVLNPDNYLVSPEKAAYSQISFWACAQDSGYPAEHFGVAVSTGGATASEFTMVQEWTMTAKGVGAKSIGRGGETKDQGNWHNFEVNLSAYAGQNIWVAIHHFNCSDEFILDVDNIALTVGGSAPIVTINEIYINGYTAPSIGAHPDVDVQVLKVANQEIAYIDDIYWYNYTNSVHVGSNDVFENNKTYFLHIDLSPAPGYEFNEDAIVYYNNDNSIHDAGYNSLTSSGILKVYTIDYDLTEISGMSNFDDRTMQGWTSIDADGDGHGWMVGTEVMSAGLNEGYGHNFTPDMVLSKSYDNNAGVLNPDNYLVSPEKAAYGQISFWACGQDANYAAEHFGVAVSTGGATASEFTMVQEWTMTAKVQGGWYEYTVDLSSYGDQPIWVAIRHFNCSDQFYLDVDDILLTNYDAVPENEVNLLSVYPNPATDKVVVTSEVSVNRYDIYDVAGAIVMGNEVNASEFDVNVSELPAGAYIIRIYSEGLVQTKRFVVK